MYDKPVFCFTEGCEKTVKPRSSSSKATAKSSSSHSAITIDTPENKAPTVNGTTMTDTRDNQNYKLINIGNKLWMAQDLNYAGVTSECYNENQETCKTNGRLYTPLNMLDESEPVPLFMPMIIGCGPAPDGMLNLDVIVAVLPPSLTVTVRVPPL